MIRTRHILLSTGLLLAACAGNDYGPSIGSVPKGMPSLDNDRAVEQEAEMKAARVEALSRRMDALKEAGEDTSATQAEIIEETIVEEKVEAIEVAAAEPTIERPVINSDPDAILKRAPQEKGVVTRAKEATRKRTPRAVETTAKAKPVVAVEQPTKEVADVRPQEMAASVAAKPIDVKLPPLGQFRVYLAEFPFGRGQNKLSGDDLEKLSKVLQPLLDRQVQGTFLVEGYASVDSKRTLKGDLSNLSLSLERATALEESLKFMGVEPGRIRVQALGQTNPHKLPGNKPRAVLWLIQ